MVSYALWKKLVLAFVAATIVAILLVAAAWFPGTNGNNERLVASVEASVQMLMPTFTVRTLSEYIEVTDSCGPHFDGACVNVRSGPGEQFPSRFKVRSGTVLQTNGEVKIEGRTWHKVIFNEWLRYPERVAGDLYVAGDYVRPFTNEGVMEQSPDKSESSKKHIIVDRSEQKLYAYEGESLFMEQSVSTGLELTPTPRGVFTVYKKTPTRYMQGPIPGISDQYYDLPGVPWDLYFTKEGGAIHGAYWHNSFGEPWSHGCVNLPTDKARELYEWADLGTPVIVRD